MTKKQKKVVTTKLEIKERRRMKQIKREEIKEFQLRLQRLNSGRKKITPVSHDIQRGIKDEITVGCLRL